MKEWITDYDVAVGRWEVVKENRNAWQFSVITEESKYNVGCYKKNGEVRKNAKKTHRVVCICSKKHDADIIAADHNFAIRDLHKEDLINVAQEAIFEHLKKRETC